MNFRLTANPVHRIRRTASEPTKRTAHMTPRHPKAWLLAEQARAGFRIEEKPRHERLCRKTRTRARRAGPTHPGILQGASGTQTGAGSPASSTTAV
ncbi:type I-E CRISPR-associated protein Cas6/Cse3/CasE [Actinacidiphila glaucinigra]|uniref:type I-E CRISPR-associated protein Cas6/Cse3/CasE n=1 Tax=Actinacidiphila glaucinigra TaxID=235986 RepID=UPI003870E936